MKEFYIAYDEIYCDEESDKFALKEEPQSRLEEFLGIKGDR